MQFRFFITVCLFLFAFPALAQRTEKVRAEYIYHAPENISLEEAKRIALERAKIQAIADEFGTIVSQSNTTMVSNRNGESSTDFFSLGGSEVKGEWIETIGEPSYDINYEQGMLVVKAIVSGRIREIVSAQIDIKAEVLCNGTDLKFARTDFKNGDDLYLYFQSPVDGYLAVYLLDEVSQTVYCLLPYQASDDGAVSIKHDVSYVFFSVNKALDNASIVDEYVMTCSNEKEYNSIYVVFSPNRFVKAKSESSDIETLPRQLPLDEFQKWLSKIRNRDKEMRVERKFIMIEK